MIICSDGVFDVMDNKDVFHLVQSHLAAKPDDLEGAARALAKRAAKANPDDVTAMVCVWSQA